MNIIKINEQQYNLLEEWGKENHELIANKFYPYLLDGKMEIEIQKNIYSCIIFNININNERKNCYDVRLEILSKLLEKEDKLTTITFAINDGKIEIDNVDMNFSENAMKAMGNDFMANSIVGLITMFRIVNAYFFNYKQDISEIEVKTVKRQSVKVKGKYKYQEVKHLNKLYTIKRTVNTRRLPKSRQWHIDSWGVVGHIRHLKNGKEVYVKPYIKGKCRLNIENNKIYKI